MHFRSQRKPLAWGAVLVVAAAASAQAHHLPLETTEGLVRKAELVVTGKVLGYTSRWNDEKTRIYTYVTIDVQATHKGQAPDKKIVIKVLGGTVGEKGMAVPGGPRFATEERVLLFLQPFDVDKKTKATNNYVVQNMDQGKLTILKDPKDKDVLFWASAMEHGGKYHTGVAIAPAYKGRPQPYAEMVKAIKGIVKRIKREQAEAAQGGAKPKAEQKPQSKKTNTAKDPDRSKAGTTKGGE